MFIIPAKIKKEKITALLKLYQSLPLEKLFSNTS